MTKERNISLPKPRYFLSEQGVKFAVYTKGQLSDVLEKKLTEVDKNYEATPAISLPTEEKRIG